MKVCFDCKRELTINAFLPHDDDFCIECRVNRGDVLCESGCNSFFDPLENYGKEDGPFCCAHCATNQETPEDIKSDWKDAQDDSRRET